MVCGGGAGGKGGQSEQPETLGLRQSSSFVGGHRLGNPRSNVQFVGMGCARLTRL